MAGVGEEGHTPSMAVPERTRRRLFVRVGLIAAVALGDGFAAAPPTPPRHQDAKSGDPPDRHHRCVRGRHALRAHLDRDYGTVRRLTSPAVIRIPVAGAALVAACALALAACGEERTYEAEEFVDEANAQGAGMELGEPLSSTDAGTEVFAIELASSATQVHGGGSLIVGEDVEEGQAEFARCESAASLICYRAANVVLRLEEIAPEQRSQLDEAFSALGSD